MSSRVNTFVKTTRFKTIVWYTLMFLILEIVFGSVIYFFMKDSLYRQLDLSLLKQSEKIYNLVRENGIDLYDFKPDSIYSSPDDVIYDLAFEAVALNPTNTFVQVKYKGKVIFQTENLRNYKAALSGITEEGEFIETFFNDDLSPHEIRESIFNRNDYQIITAFPVSLVDNALSSLRHLYLLFAPIFLLLSILGGSFIAVRSLSRIDAIIERTKYISTKNLTEKIGGEEFEDEYGRLARTMNEMILRIKNSIEYTNQFSISAAHELKTPLTILRGEIELALRSKLTPDEYRDILQSNYDETLRLINIVDKLFFISKTDHALLKINKEKTELENFLSGTVLGMRNFAEEKNCKINIDCEKGIFVEIDKGFMNQAISNLIDNALKYGNHGETIYIKGGKNEEGMVFISVSDRGQFIPDEHRTRIFERFYRMEISRSRDSGGAGLGLSVVKSIVDMHSGSIQVSSEENGLTTFTINI